MPRRKQGHLHASKRGATCTDRGSRGRSRGRSATASRFGAKSFSPACRKGGRGGSRCRSAMMKTNRVPSAGEEASFAAEDEERYLHKKFQRVDCLSPSTSSGRLNGPTDNDGASSSSEVVKPSKALEALLKVTELEIIRSSKQGLPQIDRDEEKSNAASTTMLAEDVKVKASASTSSSSSPSSSTATTDEVKKMKLCRHICNYCNHAFAKPSVLEKHIRAHTDERPYPCSLCDFAFKTKSNLYKHCKSRSHALKVNESGSNVDATVMENNMSSNEETDDDTEMQTESTPLESSGDQRDKMAGEIPRVPPIKMQTLLHNNHLVSVKSGETTTTTEASTTSEAKEKEKEKCGENKNQKNCLGVYKPKFHFTLNSEETTNEVETPKEVEKANADSNISGKNVTVIQSATTSVEPQQERQQQQQQQQTANENRNKSKATRLATPEYLKQHISNIISRNTAIVETLNPLWSRRFLRQSSVASSQNVDAELRTRDKNSGHSKLANALLRQNEEGALTGSQSLPATPSVMLAAPHFAGGFLSEVKNKLMVEHTNQQLPHTPLPQVSTLTTLTAPTITSSMSIANAHVADVAVPPPPQPPTVASAVKTLLLNKVASPSKESSVQLENVSVEGTSARILQDPSGLHPQNPEGSIIKNLLLTKRTSATPSVIVSASGQQHHETNFYANQNGSQVNEYSDSMAKNQQEQSLHTCPVCRTTFRSAETLVAHQSHYCKKSERTNYANVTNEQNKMAVNEKMKRNNECCVQPKPRGRPKGSKNRPKEILVVQQTTTRSKTNANASPSATNTDTHGKTLNALKGKLVCRQISESNADSQDGSKEKQGSDIEEGAILKKHLLMGGDKSPPLKKRKIPQEILPIEDDKTAATKSGMNTLRSLEELSRYPMRPNAVQMFGGEVQIFDGNDTKKIRIDTQQIPVTGGMMSASPIAVVHGGAMGNVSSGVTSSAVVVTIAKPVLNSGGTVMQMHDSKMHSTPSVCIPVVALGQPLMATGMLVNQAVSQADHNSNRTADVLGSKFNEVGAVVLSSNIPAALPVNSPGFYSIDISHLQINASTARTNAALSTAPRSPLFVSVVSPAAQGQMSPHKMTTPTPPLVGRIEKTNSSIKSVNPLAHNTSIKNHESCAPTSTPSEDARFNQPITPARENVIPTIKIQTMNPSSTTCKSITPTSFSLASSMPTSTTTTTTTTSIERPKTFLAPPRPTTLALKSLVHSSMVGTTLISPETPRPKKKYGQLYINGQYYTYLGLKCSTRVYYCCIYRPQPMYVPQGTDSKLSMYSNWQMVPADNNPLNLSPPIAMACYDSRQRSADKYVIAGPRKLDYIFTHSSYWTFKQQKNERNNAAKEELEMGSNRKRQKMNDDVNNSCNEQIKEEISKEIVPTSTGCGVRLDSSTVIHGKHKNKEPFSESPREVKRVRIFEGGYKSNEEYTYIRGRGRGKYVCEECGIRCKKPSMLKKHIRTHTDVRPFTCKHCNFSFKTKGNLTKHMKSKAHHKKCVELGIDPVPVTIDDAHIDEEALAQQERYEKEFGKFTDDDEDDDEEDDDEDDELDEDEEDDEDEEEDDDDDDDDLSNTDKRKRASVNRVMPGQFEDAVERKDSEVIVCKDMIQVPAEEAAARSLLDLSNHGKMETFALADNIRLIPQELNKSHVHNLTGVYPPFSSIMSITSHTQTTHSAYDVEKETNTETETEELIGNPRVVWQPSIKRLGESTDTNNYVYEQQDKQPVENSADQTRVSPDERREETTEEENFMFRAESRSSDDYMQLKEQRFTPNDNAELESARGDVDEPMDLSLTGGTRINFAPGFNEEYSSGTPQVDERRSVLVSPMKTVCESPSVESNAEMYETITPPPISAQFHQNEEFNPPTPLVNTGHAYHRLNGTVSPQSVEPGWEENKTQDNNNGGCSSMLHAYLTEKQPDMNVERKQGSKNRSLNVSQERIKQIDYPIIPVATTSSTNFPMLLGGDIVPGKSRGTEFLMPLHRSMDDGKCVCNICNKPFTKPSQLRLHVNIHYFERPFRCDSCAVSFRTKGHLQKHKRSVSHYNKVNMNMTFGTPTTDNPRPFKCIDCKIAFRIHGHLAKHLRSKMHIMKLECLGKLPFGTYAEIERSGLNLSEIDTTDCENSLDSLRLMAQRFYDKDPRRQRCSRERTVSGCSTDDGSDISHVTDDSLEGGARYRSLPSAEIGGHISPDSAEVELLSTAETLSIPGVKQEPSDMHRGEAFNRHQGQLAAPPWEEIMRQPSMESLGQEYEDISDAESEPESLGTFSTCSLCRQVFKDTKTLQLHLFVDHPDARDANGLDMRRGIRPDVPHLRMRSVSMNADAASLMEIATDISPNDVAVAMEIRRNTLSENAAIAMEMRRANSFSGEKMLRW